MATPKIFVCYSHKDEKWKDRVLLHLRPLERQGVIEIWDTSNLVVGTEWSSNIIKAIKTADVAVLLISPDFLASDYIIQREFPALLEQYQRKGLIVLPISVSPSLWTSVPQLAQFQFLNDPSKPLAVLTEDQIDLTLASVAHKIIGLTEALSEHGSREEERSKSTKPQGRSVDLRSPVENVERSLFVSHSKVDGDFAELLQLRLEREGYSTWIDVDRLGPGVDWRLEIDDAIKNSAAMIAVMSPEARQSEYVTYEWAFAWGNGRKVIPIMLRQTTMHPRLATLQFLDFTNRIARPWSKLLEALKGHQKQSKS